MVAAAKKALEMYPDARAFLLECTELPPYSDAIRASTGLPVFDAITNCNFFIAGRQDNPRFGAQGWQHKWDGEQDDYAYGSNLSKAQKAKLVNKAA